MTLEEATAHRLSRADWAQSAAVENRDLRARLMREFLRRTAIWSERLGSDELWPFGDLALMADPSIRADAQRVESVLQEMSHQGATWPPILTVARNSLQWAALRDSRGVRIDDDLDPYEPILLMFEKGGGFVPESEFFDLTAAMVRRHNAEYYRTATPFVIATSFENVDRSDVVAILGGLLPAHPGLSALTVYKVLRTPDGRVDGKLDGLPVKMRVVADLSDEWDVYQPQRRMWVDSWLEQDGVLEAAPPGVPPTRTALGDARYAVTGRVIRQTGSLILVETVVQQRVRLDSDRYRVPDGEMIRVEGVLRVALAAQRLGSDAPSRAENPFPEGVAQPVVQISRELNDHVDTTRRAEEEAAAERLHGQGQRIAYPDIDTDS